MCVCVYARARVSVCVRVCLCVFVCVSVRIELFQQRGVHVLRTAGGWFHLLAAAAPRRGTGSVQREATNWRRRALSPVLRKQEIRVTRSHYGLSSIERRKEKAQVCRTLRPLQCPLARYLGQRSQPNVLTASPIQKKKKKKKILPLKCIMDLNKCTSEQRAASAFSLLPSKPWASFRGKKRNHIGEYCNIFSLFWKLLCEGTITFVLYCDLSDNTTLVNSESRYISVWFFKQMAAIGITGWIFKSNTNLV